MKKIPILLLCLSFILMISCESKFDRAISKYSLKGAIENFNIQLSRQDRKAVKGGYLLEGFVSVPFDIKWEQVRPTLLGAIKGVKQQYKDCEWIIIWLYVGDRDMDLYAGKGEYKEDTIDLYWGIPSDSEINEWNSRGVQKEIAPETGYEVVNDASMLYRPDLQTFEKGEKIVLLFKSIDKEYADKTFKQKGYSDFLEEDEVLNLVSRKSNIGRGEVNDLYYLMNNYYRIMTWTNEAVNL